MSISTPNFVQKGWVFIFELTSEADWERKKIKDLADCDIVVTCNQCKQPAFRLDHYYPYDSGCTACIRHVLIEVMEQKYYAGYKSDSKAFESVYISGWEAYLKGDPLTACPYGDHRTTRGTVTFSRGFIKAWKTGWNAAHQYFTGEKGNHGIKH